MYPMISRVSGSSRDAKDLFKTNKSLFSKGLDKVYSKISIAESDVKDYFNSHQDKFYQLNDSIATLMVRPRGWHLYEKNIELVYELI